MVAQGYLILIVISYLLLLFALAYYAERKEKSGRSIVNNPYIYALSLAVYCTAWTFYGSVGMAATSGLSFLPVYLGPTVMAAAWPCLLRKIVRIAKANRITTISDFISSRYGKSLSLSILVTIVTVVGMIPYISLQLKAITSTFVIISGKTLTFAGELTVAFMLGIFTIIFGTRRLDASERHGGIVFAIAFESLVKLCAFLLVGLFVTYTLFDGFRDIFDKIQSSGHSGLLLLGPGTGTSYSEWFAITFLSMMAIIFLPRGFHMAVVENYDERHINKAAWLFPLYLLLINIFVLPVAFGGLLLEGKGSIPDYYVLNLPLHHENRYLAVFVFIGGFSAATGMVIVESLAISTMVMNSILMPTMYRFQDIPGFSSIVLNTKRLVIQVIIFSGFLFMVTMGTYETLVEIGLKSFEAVTLFAPAFILGLFWKRGNKTGAILGIIAGFLVWLYTSILPLMLKAGIMGNTGLIGLLTHSETFNPYRLFGVSGLGTWAHTLFWSLFFNVVLYVAASLFTSQSNEEEIQSFIFVEETCELPVGDRLGVSYAVSDTYTVSAIENTLAWYLGMNAAREAIEDFSKRKMKTRDDLSSMDLYELRDESEKILSGAVGSSMASIIFENRFVMTEGERRQISESLRNFSESLRLSRQDLAKANRELRESERKYRELFEDSIDIVFFTTPEGKFTDINDAAVKIFGYASKEELLKIDIARDLYCNPEDRHKLEEIIDKQGYVKDYEVLLKRKDGERLNVLVTATAVRDETGKVIAYRGISRDITTQRRLEVFNQAMETIIAERTMNLMALKVADRVRNPATIIAWMSKKTMGKGIPEELKESLAVIKDEGEKLEAIVKEFQSTLESRRSLFVYEDVNDIVRNIVAITEDEADRKGIRLVSDISEKTLKINMQRDLLQVAILHFVRNAMEATPPGGEITIQTYSENDKVIVLISDTGSGIPEGDVEKIFDPFYSTKMHRYGMGLPLVKQIVSEHMGEIDFESKPGVGTTFRMVFPARWV